MLNTKATDVLNIALNYKVIRLVTTIKIVVFIFKIIGIYMQNLSLINQ